MGLLDVRSGGIPILFPLTSESASASAAPSPPGFASSQDWEVVETVRVRVSCLHALCCNGRYSLMV